MQDKNVAPGLSERILKEIIATPALKELILLRMKDIKAQAPKAICEIPPCIVSIMLPRGENDEQGRGQRKSRIAW